LCSFLEIHVGQKVSYQIIVIQQLNNKTTQN